MLCVIVYTELYRKKQLKDYKFFCFNGKVYFFKVDFNRFEYHRVNYYEPCGSILQLGEEVFPSDYKKNVFPKNLNNMICMAENLSKQLPFVRIDLYSYSNNIYFGEMTFYLASGLGKFTDDKWDRKIGDLIKISEH